MRIIIDIGHPAHINFLKPVISRFKEEGNEILVTVLRRGKLPEIAKKELTGCNIRFVGGHRRSKWSIIVESNILRFFQILRICMVFRPDAGLSAGSFILGAALKILGKPNIQFDDDPERKFHVFLEKKTATNLYFPGFYQHITSHVGSFNALKEWAYLSPDTFIPDVIVLKEYNLEPKEYIFVREIDTGSFNYMNQSSSGIAEIAAKFPKEIPVILSLENKSNAQFYPPEWIILKEPVPGIHSLMYFSRLIISSGDSMAREGAMLGVNSVYCGSRTMLANEFMALHGSFTHIKPSEIPVMIAEVFQKEEDFRSVQELRRINIQEKWCNVTAFIYDKFYLMFK